MRERILGIQFARGVAALLVVIYHGCRMVSLPQYAGRIAFDGFFNFGHAGVDFFFVLSGFIIFFVHHSDLGRPQRVARYAWRRVTRIFPSYWLILGLIVMMMAAKHDPDLTAPHFLKSLFLIPDDQPPLLGVAWTLIFEMLFYAIFALGILNFRLGVAIALVWFLVVVSQAAAESQINYLRLFSSPRNLQFAMGIAAAYVVLKGSARAPLFLIAAGVCAFFVTGMVENAHVVGWDGIFSKLLFGFSSAIAIVGVALAERQGLLRFGKAGEFFGGTSYLLYLVHTLALGLCFHAIQIAGLYSFLPAEMAVLIGSAASVAVASILYIFFDKPVQGILRHFEKRYLFGANEASAAVSRTG